jgi:hypothetical protein
MHGSTCRPHNACDLQQQQQQQQSLAAVLIE